MPKKVAVPRPAAAPLDRGNSNPSPPVLPQRTRPPPGTFAEDKNDAAIVASEADDAKASGRHRARSALPPSRFAGGMKNDEAFEGEDAARPDAGAEEDEDEDADEGKRGASAAKRKRHGPTSMWETPGAAQALVNALRVHLPQGGLSNGAWAPVVDAVLKAVPAMEGRVSESACYNRHLNLKGRAPHERTDDPGLEIFINHHREVEELILRRGGVSHGGPRPGSGSLEHRAVVLALAQLHRHANSRKRAL